MIGSMEKHPHLRSPKIYKTPSVRDGEEVVVHILQENQQFVRLSFKEQNTTPEAFDSEAMLSYDLDQFSSDKDITAMFDKIEQSVLDLGNIYTSYSYLFTLINKKMFLVSVSIGNLSLGFGAVKDIAEKVGVETIKANWRGIYTAVTWAAFYEDIFIQNS